jgi:hypothetical protein
VVVERTKYRTTGQFVGSKTGFEDISRVRTGFSPNYAPANTHPPHSTLDDYAPQHKYMKTPYLFAFFSFLSFSLFAQTTLIKGRVTDASKNALPGANILLRDTYDGATADANGAFEFETEETGPQTLQVTYLGFDSVVQQVTLSGGVLEFNPVMRESFNELKVVVISAGAFEASDEKKVTVLKPLDIVTTASAGGDIYGAMKTLPGAQVSTGDVEGLFVRGGSGSEAPTFIDGMLVRNPFFASSPDYASRGRFNPFLFKGTVFSTGGYSAQYGQGMSSALVLESADLPDRSAGTGALSSVGIGFGQVQLSRDKRRSVGGSVNYSNLAPYFWLIKETPDFTQKPESVGTEAFFRQKTGNTGLLKFYGYYNWGRVGFNIDAPDGNTFGFSVKNHNMYTNLSWSDLLGEYWKLQLGTSFSRDWNNIGTSFNTSNISPDTFFLRNSFGQFRAVATRFFGRLTSLRFGGEMQFGHEEFENRYFGASDFNDRYSAGFVETDLYMTTKLVARLGLRAEHSSLLEQARVSPRVSLAYKLGDGDQVSFAWGHFYQKGDSLLRWQNQYGQIPGYQRAEHFILNYQYIFNERTFRVEGFYKKYRDLVTTRGALRNDGTGYAQGIEFFYRDKKSLKNMDFWLSYSWLDTKRQFQWYPVEAQPGYAANHVSTLVVKKFFPNITSSLSLSYNYATGRPFFNPNRPESEFLADRTPDYHNLSLSASYLTTIRGAFTVFVLSVQNVLRQNQVFDYRYSPDGTMRTEISPAAKQFFFVGAFFSWGTDRRQEVLDNQL